MARGRGDRAGKAAAGAAAAPPIKVKAPKAVPPRAKTRPKGGAGPVLPATKPKAELEQFDLRAALPFFLARIGIFLVITAVLFFAVGLNILVAVLLGLIGGAAAGYPLARMQKRAAHIETPTTPAPPKVVKPPKAKR